MFGYSTEHLKLELAVVLRARKVCQYIFVILSYKLELYTSFFRYIAEPLSIPIAKIQSVS